MSGTLAIFKREIKSYLASPIAYVTVTVFLALSGIFFFFYLDYFVQIQYSPEAFQFTTEKPNLNDLVIRPYFGTISVVLLLMIPIVTMRLIAEEKKSHTTELLFTSPIRVFDIVFGKYLASLLLFVLMIAFTGVYMVILGKYGNPDPGPIYSGYLGLFLLGSTFLSVGLLSSSLTQNQIIAAIISFGALLFFWILGAASEVEASVAGYLSILNHFDSFTKGIVDIRDVVFYLSFIFLSLFLTYVSLDSQRWR